MQETEERIRMYAVFAADAVAAMKGNRGKLAAQAGHAYLHAWWDADKRFMEADFYRYGPRAYKIALVVPTAADLEPLFEAYKTVCGVSLVTDAGLTVFDGPTTTCLGIGPIRESLIGDDLKALKVLI